MKHCFIFLLITLAILPLNLHSQVTTQTQQQKRLALVIGNGNYQFGILANPENDARAMKTALLQLGFEVLEYENLSQNQMKRAMDDFGMKLKNCDVGLFFYAGHGIQSKGFNYLIPIDADVQAETQVEFDCVQADRVVSFMEESGARVKLIILDACRNNPFERSWTRTSTGRGLATMNAPSGTLIAYATSPGSTASDGSGRNGLYTSAILENIVKPNITILQMFQNVRATVADKSNKQQIPWESTSLIGDFYFNPSEPTASNADNITENKSLRKGPDILNEVSQRTAVSEEYLIRNTISNIRIVDVKKAPGNEFANSKDSILIAGLNQGRNKGIKKGSVVKVYDVIQKNNSLGNSRTNDSIYSIGTIYIKSSSLSSSDGELKLKDLTLDNYSQYSQLLCKHKRLFNVIYALCILNLVDKTDPIEPSYNFNTTGLGLGYMIYRNWGGYIEIDNGRDSFNDATVSCGLVKEISATSVLRLGLGIEMGAGISNVSIGGGTNIKHFSVIYVCYVSVGGFSFGKSGISLGLGYNF